MDLLDQRAEQVVDREATGPLAPTIRRQRVVNTAQEVLQWHDCDHSGGFSRLGRPSLAQLVCEMCGAAHWGYPLSCNRCHILACGACVFLCD